jgi:hypothetical protein
MQGQDAKPDAPGTEKLWRIYLFVEEARRQGRQGRVFQLVDSSLEAVTRSLLLLEQTKATLVGAERSRSSVPRAADGRRDDDRR